MMRKALLGMMVLVMGCHVVYAQKSIVILYENDAHCGIDGYTKMAGLRDAINKADTAYAAATSCRATPREPSQKVSISLT